MLLGSDSVQSSEDSEKKQASWRAYAPHRDEEQVKLDVHRSFVYYPSGEYAKQLCDGVLGLTTNNLRPIGTTA